MQRQEREVKIFEYPNAIVRVHIPDLAKEEKEKRLAEIKKSAIQILKGVEKCGQ